MYVLAVPFLAEEKGSMQRHVEYYSPLSACPLPPPREWVNFGATTTSNLIEGLSLRCAQLFKISGGEACDFPELGGQVGGAAIVQFGGNLR